MTLKANYPGITVEIMRSKYHAEKDPRLKERYLAIRLSYEGYKCEFIADILDRNRVTVQDWVRTFNERGLESLQDEDRPGRPAKLTTTEQETLKKNVTDATR